MEWLTWPTAFTLVSAIFAIILALLKLFPKNGHGVCSREITELKIQLEAVREELNKESKKIVALEKEYPGKIADLKEDLKEVKTKLDDLNSMLLKFLLKQ